MPHTTGTSPSRAESVSTPAAPRLVAALLLALLLSSAAVAAETGWAVDADLLFHLAVEGDPGPGGQPAQSLGLAPDSQPDIRNIPLSGLLGLGFPVQDRPDAASQTFYLKFYRYPEGLDPALSARRVLEPLRVLEMSRGADLRSWLDGGHVVVKKGLVASTGRPFGEEDPFPPLRVAGQEALDRAVIFSSLYVTGSGGGPARTLRGTPAEGSADGVLAFHEELLGLYRKEFGEPVRQEGRFVFTDGGRTLAVPERPLVFDGYASLPMPQDPERMFLTGLLLVSEQWGDRSRVFEVGSVVRLP